MQKLRTGKYRRLATWMRRWLVPGRRKTIWERRAKRGSLPARSLGQALIYYRKGAYRRRRRKPPKMRRRGKGRTGFYSV